MRYVEQAESGVWVVGHRLRPTPPVRSEVEKKLIVVATMYLPRSIGVIMLIKTDLFHQNILPIHHIIAA